MMRAVILAAGRGSRMGALTEAMPKCLTELAGRPLLAMQCAALAAAGASEVGIVTGYRAELLALPGLSRFHNPRWDTTNMVWTNEPAVAWTMRYGAPPLRVDQGGPGDRSSASG